MARYRKHSMASAVALAMSLTACGGGGGGEVASIPPPPPAPASPAPAPSPPPPPTPAAPVSAAAPASAPNANLFPQATTGGPTIETHPETAFPLLETVVKIDSAGAAADTAAISGGATLSFASTGKIADAKFTFDVPGLGLSNVSLASGGWYCYALACGGGGGKNIDLDISDPATNNLDWTTYGVWVAYQGSTSTTHAAFVTGYTTPAASVPTTGSGTYNGFVNGTVMSSQAGQQHGVAVHWLTGEASLQANFGSGAITGSLTNMKSGTGAWNSVSLLGTVAAGQNSFSGISSASSAPGTPGSLSSSATGTFGGMFFGPSAQELGAVWTLHDGVSTAIGTFAARTGP